MDLIRTTKTTSHGHAYRLAFGAVTKTQEKESAERHPLLPRAFLSLYSTARQHLGVGTKTHARVRNAHTREDAHAALQLTTSTDSGAFTNHAVINVRVGADVRT